MTFRLAPLSVGDNPLYWDDLSDLLGVADEPVEPDANYRPQSEAVVTLDGQTLARGYAVALWTFSGLTPAQRYALRQICPGLSADVYIETLTNEFGASGNRIWIQAQAIMHWTDGDEDIAANATLNCEVRFTHLIEV